MTLNHDIIERARVASIQERLHGIYEDFIIDHGGRRPGRLLISPDNFIALKKSLRPGCVAYFSRRRSEDGILHDTILGMDIYEVVNRGPDVLEAVS